LILIDFRLDYINGIKFAKELRKLRGYDIFIKLTTQDFKTHSLREIEIINVVNAVLVKPFSLKYLDMLINRYMNCFIAGQS
jgi:DNA-binding response OmpR family regulator